MLISLKKLTKVQQGVIALVRELEERYGVGTVFIQYNKAMNRYGFIIHQKGEQKYITLQKYINIRTYNALKKLGLLYAYDSMHCTVNYCQQGAVPIGERVMLEFIEE